jgi:chaperonin cofactor prefoldin
MKTFFLLMASAFAAAAQIPVTDVAVLAQTIQEVAQAIQQVQLAKTELERLGDPASIVSPTAKDLIRSISRVGQGKTLDDMQRIADGVAALSYAANGLYRAPGAVMYRADGSAVVREVQQYRKFDALTRARATLETVLSDTEERRQLVRLQIQRTLNQLMAAATPGRSYCAKL